jgi:hypothetical protein
MIDYGQDPTLVSAFETRTICVLARRHARPQADVYLPSSKMGRAVLGWWRMELSMLVIELYPTPLISTSVTSSP